MEKVRYGIVGLGNQGSYYALSLFAAGLVPDAIITAMCDTNPVKIESMKEKYKGEGASEVVYFSDYKEMLDSGLVDAVFVETPHYFHPVIVKDCLAHHINVICDKPAGVYTQQVREMNELAEKSDVKFTMMFNQRTNCLYRKMREMVQNGEIGTFQRVNWIITNWFRTANYYNSGSWRATWNGEGGGVLINQCPHQLDLVQWIVGKLPTKVTSICQYGKWHDIEVEDDVTAMFEYDDGATGVFVTTTGEAPGDNRLEISGTKGKLVCEDGKLWFYKNAEDSYEFSLHDPSLFGQPKVEKIEVETDGENPQHLGIVKNFTAALLGKEELFVNGTEGIRGVELMNAIELSGWKKGKTVTIPVCEDEYLRYLTKKCKSSKKKVANDNMVADTNNTFWNVKV